MHLAERIDGTGDSVGLGIMGYSVLESANHGDTGDGRVDGEEDVVKNDEGIKGAGFAESPGLVSMTAIVFVQENDGGCVDGCDGERYLEGQSCGEDVFGDGEGCLEGVSFEWRRNWGRRWVGGEFEDGPRG